MEKLILASGSPRRRELLGLLTKDFSVCVSQADETVPMGTPPDEAVQLLALRKARAVAGEKRGLIIGADTLVVIDGKTLGKPGDAHEAGFMLRQLSGRVHEVYTGVALVSGERAERFCCSTAVEFAPLRPEEIDWYIATGEPFDKAGGYGIQGPGARFIRRIDGDFFNVMGLPVQMLYQRLLSFAGWAPGQEADG